MKGDCLFWEKTLNENGEIYCYCDLRDNERRGCREGDSENCALYQNELKIRKSYKKGGSYGLAPK